MVVDLAARREQRDAEAARAHEARERARADHPALRWVAGSAFYVAHRKVVGAAACGARGSLMLAPPGVPLCVQCYPPEERRT